VVLGAGPGIEYPVLSQVKAEAFKTRLRVLIKKRQAWIAARRCSSPGLVRNRERIECVSDMSGLVNTEM
jgi:hypothetical protein